MLKRFPEQSARNEQNTTDRLFGEELVEPQTIPDTSSLASEYDAALAALIEEKCCQSGHIEDRLEELISQQEALIKKTASQKLGILSLPGHRTAWKVQIQRQRSRLDKLEVRLDNVRSIKNSMGLHAPRIEELAVRRLRAERPELAEA